MSGNINDTMMSKAEKEAFDKSIGIDMKKKDKYDRQIKGENLLNYYKVKLADACANFYKLVTEDEEANEVLFQEHSQQWKLVANNANRLQKIIKVNPFAFEVQIARYKEAAENRAKEVLQKKQE